MTSDQTWSGSCPPVFGEVDDGYGALMDAFVGNFDERGDVGAGCTVYVNGRMVVDLWAGVADRRTRRP